MEGYYCRLGVYIFILIDGVIGEECFVGYYCVKGIVVLEECLLGTFLNILGLISIDNCINCIFGLFCNGSVFIVFSG